jgi:hypothetical protein
MVIRKSYKSLSATRRIVQTSFPVLKTQGCPLKRKFVRIKEI